MNARVLICLVSLAVQAHAAPLLSIDFNCRANSAATNTQPGFSSFLITSNISANTAQTNATVRTFGAYRVQLWGNGPFRGYMDRLNDLPTNRAAFTESALLRDGVFSPDITTNGGLNLLIENLPASNRFQVTIWSFDAESEPSRVSDWYANRALVRRAYQFISTALPARNDECRFSFTAVTDATGQLLIEGRRNPMSTNIYTSDLPAVYLNALQIDPEPLDILSITTNANELRITFVVRPQPGTYLIEETAGGAWAQSTGVIYGTAANNRVTARIPRPTQSRLYRVRYNY